MDFLEMTEVGERTSISKQITAVTPLLQYCIIVVNHPQH